MMLDAVRWLVVVVVVVVVDCGVRWVRVKEQVQMRLKLSEL